MDRWMDGWMDDSGDDDDDDDDDDVPHSSILPHCRTPNFTDHVDDFKVYLIQWSICPRAKSNHPKDLSPQSMCEANCLVSSRK